MSQRPTVITDDLYDYMLEMSSGEDEFLRELKATAKIAGIPEISISPEQARFMQFYIKSIKAKNILEIGSLAGYSAIAMARALPEGGKLVTVELEEKHYLFTKSKVVEAGLENVIEVVHSSGLKYLKSIENAGMSFDFIFVDADKPNYYKYMIKSLNLLPSGGAFAADNAFAFGFVTDSAPERNPADVKSIKSFNREFTNYEEFFTALVPVGDGLIIGLKK